MSTLYGQIGHFLVLLSFVSAILASLSFFFASKSEQNKQEQKSWYQIGSASFSLHGISIIAIFSTLFLMIINHQFQYYYVWQHSSKDLPWRYLLSCFWEGQEGSFLLWAFWHVVLGAIIMMKKKDYSSPVLMTISIVQIFLTSMLLGLYFGTYKIGSSPFILMKDAMPETPIFSINPNYVPEDGSGLNPLLQNYWMTIHPPTLFLGFASTVVPFAFAIASLWKKKYKEWILPALPWTLFSGMILGVGILMGGAWAYEALSFGGFWAWDPVENASLVPWLTLIAGLHTLVIYKSTGQSLRATFIFFILTFFLILYSTFLTRSGILGDSSVHSFTDLGMSGQLIIYMAALTIPSILLFLLRWKKVPTPQKEEATFSREFWMFIGSIVLCISALQITFSTSIPVINKIFGTELAPPIDAIAHYNKWQLPLAMIVAFLTATIQFFKYKKTSIDYFLKQIALSGAMSMILTAIIVWSQQLYSAPHIAFTFSAVYAILGNFDFIIRSLSGKIKMAGGSISHIGFGLMLLGILISNAKQEVISTNQMGISYGEGFDAQSNRENVLLSKNVPTKIKDYEATYLSDSTVGENTYFKVLYKKFDADGKLEETFTLHPNVQINERMGDVANPDTRHYWARDIYTHITAMKAKSNTNEEESFKIHKINVGDTIGLDGAYAVLKGLDVNPQNLYDAQEGDIAIGAVIYIQTIDSNYTIEPIYFIRENHEYVIPTENESLGIKMKFVKVHPEDNSISLEIAQKDITPAYIIMKAIVFPYINLLWIGVVIMTIGFLISIYRRVKT